MKKSKINLIAFIYLIFFSSFTFGQNIGEQWNCQTVRKNNIQIISERWTYNTNPKIINIFIHIVKRDNGTAGVTDNQVNNSISILRLDYQAKNIFFNEIGREYINSTEFCNGISNSNYNSLINTNRHNNAIDIYFLSPTDDYARASGIPGDALAFGGYYSETSVLSHEIGHCLGLYHTHSGSGCEDYANCAENIDRSNCANCGDLVCDTPADPCLSGNVDSNCNYIGDDDYSPDVSNIMSYAPQTCLNSLTSGQEERLHNVITNNEILSQLSFAPEISGSNIICLSNQTYTVQNYPNNVSIIWSKSNNLNYINGQGTNNFTVEAYNNGYSGNTGWIQANINGIITIRKNVLLGVRASFNGSSIIDYLETGSWTINATGCYPPYSYEWFLRKENNGPPVSVASSTWNRLILQSVQAKSKNSKTNKDSLKQPDEYTIFYLHTRVRDSDGFNYDTPEMRIVANGEVDLVPAFMPKNENNKSPDVTETEYVKLFPNPTSNNLTIKIVSDNSNIENVEVILFDKYMKTQKHKKAFGNELLLNVSNLPKGIYFLQIKYNDKIFFEKVMIE